MTRLALVFLVAVSAACSSGSSGTASGGGSGSSSGSSSGTVHTVYISNDGGFGTISPLDVTVSPGDTIQWVNYDLHAHELASESAANAFDGKAAPSGGFAFDAGTVPSNGTPLSFVVPTTVASGTVQPYYCPIHTTGMTTPNATITVQ